MGSDLKGRKVKSGSKNPDKFDIQYEATETIASGDICFEAGVSGNWIKLEKADGDVAVESRGRLYISRTPCQAGRMGRATMFGVLTGVDTSGATVGDPVFLSGTAGGFTLTAGGVKRRRIGTVLVVSATVGQIGFDGSPPACEPVFASTAEVASGQSSVTITAATLGGTYGGRPVVACLNETDGTAGRHVVKATWSTDDLVITLDGNTDGIRTVGFIIGLGA